jgi:hypothetical protein
LFTLFVVDTKAEHVVLIWVFSCIKSPKYSYSKECLSLATTSQILGSGNVDGVWLLCNAILLPPSMKMYMLHYESHTSDHLNSLVIIMCEFNLVIWIVLSVQDSLHHGQSQHTSIFYHSSGTKEFAYIYFLLWRWRVAYTHDGILGYSIVELQLMP